MRLLKKEIWPYSITIPWVEWEYVEKMDAWCDETVGKRFKQWYGYNTWDEKRIYAFKDEQTLLVFKLIWGYK